LRASTGCSGTITIVRVDVPAWPALQIEDPVLRGARERRYAPAADHVYWPGR
jgi:hypothetical protein